MVFYRKYRPQKISDLDSKNVREILSAVLAKPSSLPHAFLFTGPKGLGKTSAARIVAKVVNCTTSKTKRENEIEPCNVCDQCTSVTNGTNIDVLEVDGASNRGIDEVRELRERVKLAPSAASKKVYIIDEVHMLTTEAFNALLKTIEEPPAHVMFIFCTTEPQKVPATILSRCFHIEFKKASDEEIIHSLKRIVSGEKILFASDLDEKEILLSIAKQADGGFRDATKLLEEVAMLFQDKKITKGGLEKINRNFTIGIHVSGFLLRLSKSDRTEQSKKTQQALNIVKSAVESGIDMKFFISSILESLHQELLKETGVIERVKGESSIFTTQELQILFELFTKAYQDSKFAVISQLPLEIAIIQWNEFSKVPEITKEVSVKPNIASLMKQQQSIKVKKVLYPEKEEKPKETLPPSHMQHDINSAPDDKTSLLENIIYKVKPFNHSVAGVLRGCKIKEVTNSEIIFETPYNFHKERLEERKTCEIIGEAVKDITGKSLQVTVQLNANK